VYPLVRQHSDTRFCLTLSLQHVFTTEGHPLRVLKEHERKRSPFGLLGSTLGKTNVPPKKTRSNHGSTRSSRFNYLRGAGSQNNQHQHPQPKEEEREESYVQITAPSALPEGYEFEVKLSSGEPTFKIKIPRGGVQKGHTFIASYPSGNIVNLGAGPTKTQEQQEQCQSDAATCASS
jgi:hypothetical protein